MHCLREIRCQIMPVIPFYFIYFSPWKVGETAPYSWIKISNFLPIPRVTSRRTTAARSRAHLPSASRLSDCPWTLPSGKNLWLLTSPCQCPSLNMIGRPHLLMARRSRFLGFHWKLKGLQLENLMCIYNVLWRKRLVPSISRYSIFRREWRSFLIYASSIPA